MSSNEKKWWKKLISPSSPDAFRQDTHEELRKMEVEKETKEELSKIRKENLKKNIELQASESRPAKDKSNIVRSDEKAGDAKKFLDRESKREKSRKEAMKQGGPEEQSEDKG